MGIFRRKQESSIQPVAPEATPPSNGRLSKVIDIGSSDSSVGDSHFTLPFLTGLHNLGYQRATDAGITEVTEEFMTPLTEHARGIAREYTRVVFDPKQHLHDKLQFDEYNRALKARDNAVTGEDYAVSRLRQAKQELDATKRVGNRPARPVLLLLMCVAMISVSLCATVHDRLIPVGIDPMLSIVLSMIIGMLLGAAPVYAIFHSRNSNKRWIAIVIAVLVGVGLFTVRVSGAESSGEVLYAAGWAALELAGIILAEYLSQAHRKAEVEWEQEHYDEVAAVAAVASANEDVDLWRARIAAAQHELDRIGGVVHDRNTRALRVNEIELLCVKAVRDGAHAGAAANLGIVRGLKRPPQPALPSKSRSKEAL